MEHKSVNIFEAPKDGIDIMIKWTLAVLEIHAKEEMFKLLSIRSRRQKSLTKSTQEKKQGRLQRRLKSEDFQDCHLYYFDPEIEIIGEDISFLDETQEQLQRHSEPQTTTEGDDIQEDASPHVVKLF